MKKVIILLPTYNGEKYIRYQLDSIIAQTYKNIEVYIRDDGSTDATVKIIEEYTSNTFDGVSFYKIDSNGENLGFPDCFWRLVQNAPNGDYYAFCDQDDWWYPEKIETAIRYLEPFENEPAITYCSFDYFDGDMNYLRSGENYRENPELINGMYYTFSPGFTQVFNATFKNYLDCDYLFHKKIAHDIWCQWIGLSFGKLLPEKEVLAKYRRHESAVTAANKGTLKSVKGWLEDEILGDAMKIWKGSLSYFYQKHKMDIDSKNRVLLETIVNDSLKNRMNRIFKMHNLRPTLGGNVALKILFILGKC